MNNRIAEHATINTPRSCSLSSSPNHSGPERKLFLLSKFGVWTLAEGRPGHRGTGGGLRETSDLKELLKSFSTVTLRSDAAPVKMPQH